MDDLIMTELNTYTMPWIRQIFLGGNVEVIGSSFNHIDNKYHLWIKNKDESNIRSEQLLKMLHFAKPEIGRWYKSEESEILSKDDLDRLDLGKIKLVPEVERIMLVTENEVQLDQLKPYKV